MTAPAGISTANSALTIDYSTLGAGTHTVIVTATDIDADASTDVFVLQVLNYVSTLNDNSLASTVALTGTSLDDAITGNSFAMTNNYLTNVDFDGGDGNDTIISNTLTAGGLHSITFDGGAGNDTIISNTLTASDDVETITFDGGEGDDTISDNHFEWTGTDDFYVVYNDTLMGGAGDDLFRNNSATQAYNESTSMTIDGGDGEDTVVFRSIADEYTGLSDWIDGVTTITLTGDGAAVTLIDVETIAFADGASYSAANAAVEGNGGVLYDLANAFTDTFSAFSTDSGTITAGTLALAGTELGHGSNKIVITATAGDNSETTETITVNVVRELEILIGVKQRNQQTFDLGDVFVETNTTAYTTLSLPSGVTLGNGNLVFDNTVLSIDVQPVTITATDGSDAVTHTLIYALDAIKDQTFSDGGSNTTYIGTTLADAITGNSFAMTNNYLTNVDLDGGAGDDTISNNTLTGYRIFSITFDGGADNDTISSNTITASRGVFSITFDGGAGDDTISDNHFESTGTQHHYDLYSVTLMGGG